MNTYVNDPSTIYAKTVTFTGHRPKNLLGYDRNAYTLLNDFLVYNVLEPLFQNGSTSFITGGAQGFDQLAFWAVDTLKRNHPNANIENQLYLPNKIQADRWSQHGLFSKDEYTNMCIQATSIKVLNKTINERSAYHKVVQSLYARNHAMIDHANLLIALVPYNGQITGGTKEAMDYATKKNVPIFCIKYILTNKVVPVDFTY